MKKIEIIFVSYKNKSLIEFNKKLILKNNPNLTIKFSIYENSDNLYGYKGISKDPTDPISPASYQHAKTLQLALWNSSCKDIFIIDPDFFIIKKNFFNIFLNTNKFDIVGSDWHPRWINKKRNILNCVHFLYFNLNKVSKYHINFLPEYHSLEYLRHEKLVYRLMSIRKKLLKMPKYMFKNLINFLITDFIHRLNVESSPDTGSSLRHLVNSYSIKKLNLLITPNCQINAPSYYKNITNRIFESLLPRKFCFNNFEYPFINYEISNKAVNKCLKNNYELHLYENFIYGIHFRGTHYKEAKVKGTVNLKNYNIKSKKFVSDIDNMINQLANFNLKN